MWRLTRIGVVTGAALVLSVLGHILGGGAPPQLPALTTVGVLTLLVATVLTTSRVSAARLGVALAGLQTVSHLIFHHAVGTPPVTLVAGGHLNATAGHGAAYGLSGSSAAPAVHLAGAGHLTDTMD